MIASILKDARLNQLEIGSQSAFFLAEKANEWSKIKVISDQELNSLQPSIGKGGTPPPERPVFNRIILRKIRDSIPLWGIQQ